jgi:hypothetical protein
MKSYTENTEEEAQRAQRTNMKRLLVMGLRTRHDEPGISACCAPAAGWEECTVRCLCAHTGPTTPTQ